MYTTLECYYHHLDYSLAELIDVVIQSLSGHEKKSFFWMWGEQNFAFIPALSNTNKNSILSLHTSFYHHFPFIYCFYTALIPNYDDPPTHQNSFFLFFFFFSPNFVMVFANNNTHNNDNNNDNNHHTHKSFYHTTSQHVYPASMYQSIIIIIIIKPRTDTNNLRPQREKG